MSEVNIDANLVERGGGNLSQTEEKLVEMSNGCIFVLYVKIFWYKLEN